MQEHERSGTEIVDGLRGFAILWVLCYHTWLFSWYTPQLRVLGWDVPVDVLPRTGYLGVDLFFAISGFCLFVPAARRAVSGAAEPSLEAWLARRALKIFPSYAIAVLATIPFALPLVGAQGEVWRALAVHFTFVHSFYVDAFGRANSVFWSLALEVQFYVIFPALAWVFRRSPFVTAAAMIALALGYRLHFAPCCLRDEIVVRQLPAFLDVFACGMLAAYAVVWAQRHGAWLVKRRILTTLAALALLATTFILLQTCNAVQYIPGGRERWDIYGRTLFAMLTGAFIFCASFALRSLRAALANPVLTFLSLVSYNLYLWHTLLMIYMWKHRIPPTAAADPHSDGHWQFSYIVSGWTASIAVATLITYFIERPLLGLVKPHDFAFDWARIARRFSVRRKPPIATPETRT